MGDDDMRIQMESPPGQLRTPTAKDALTKALWDPDPYVRKYAADALN